MHFHYLKKTTKAAKNDTWCPFGWIGHPLPTFTPPLVNEAKYKMLSERRTSWRDIVKNLLHTRHYLKQNKKKKLVWSFWCQFSWDSLWLGLLLLWWTILCARHSQFTSFYRWAEQNKFDYIEKSDCSKKQNEDASCSKWPQNWHVQIWKTTASSWLDKYNDNILRYRYFELKIMCIIFDIETAL